MIAFVPASARITAGLLVTVVILASSVPTAAQPRVGVKVSGPGSGGAYIETIRIGGGPGAVTTTNAGGDGSASVSSSRLLGGGSAPLQPGLYEVWVESGRKDAGGNYISGSTFVYVGKDGATNVNFDLTGRPPSDPSGARVFQIGMAAKANCHLVTYQRAVNQLTAYVADLDRAMADLRSALDAYLRDGGLDGVPEPYRTNVGGIILAGGTPREISNGLDGIAGEHRKANPNGGNPLSVLNDAYRRLAIMAEERAQYVDYLQKLQPAPECGKRTAMYQDSLRPINIGPKGTVGCDAKLKQDLVGALGGGGGLGGLAGGGRSVGIGGGGGGLGGLGGRNNPASRSGSPSANEPKLSPDPVPADMKWTYSMSGAELALGTRFTDKGLWLSANILKAPCQGTFQTVYLRDPETGQKAGPTEYVLTELYSEWKLTVNWTYDRYVNNQHVEHKSGGWKEGGRDFLGSWIEPSNGKGVWNDLGWGTAVAGAKGMGFFFPITYGDFAKKPLDIVVHVSNPDSDPAGTIGFGFETTPVLRQAGDFGRVGVAKPNAPSQKGSGARTWKTPYAADFRYTAPPPPP